MPIDRDEHQRDALRRLTDKANSHLSVVACAPTGYGKTRISTMLANDWAIPAGMPWEFLTNRRSLLDQTILAFEEANLDFGVRAAGYMSRFSPEKKGQITIAQSDSAAIKGGHWKENRPVALVIDEIHNNLGGYVQRRINEHLDRGLPVIGLTATPVGLGGHFKHLEVLCKLSELREMGGALLAECHTPSEVDLKDIRKVATPGALADEMGRRFMQQQVVGSIIEHWRRLNPRGWPTIQFNPCIESSMWFCDEWNRAGVPSAHIDGEHIYYGGWKDGEREFVPSNRKTRNELRKQVYRGLIKVVNNRFVMREGVDWPFLYHAIFATRMGHSVPWVQSCGRILRSCPEKFKRYSSMKTVICQDHGGNLYAIGLGSPNADREWSLHDTPHSVMADARERVRKQEDHQAVCCPTCQRPIKWEVWQKNGGTCPYCKREFAQSSRVVIQTNGELREVKGMAERINVRMDSLASDMQRAWNKLYFPSKNSKSPRSSTFGQLGARFNKQYPNFLVTSGYATVEGKKVKVSGIKDTATGQFHAIDNIPAPSSPVWKQAVKKTRAGALQHGHVKVVDRQGPAREPVPGNQSKKKAEPRRPADRDLFNQGE